jgi:hypothetical protein
LVPIAGFGDDWRREIAFIRLDVRPV